MTSEVLRQRLAPESLGRKDSDTSTASGAWGCGLAAGCHRGVGGPAQPPPGPGAWERRWSLN
jgi:hypothetical protein